MRTYGALRYDAGAWILDAEPHVHLRAKRVFGRLSKQAAGFLKLSHSIETCHELAWFMDRYPLTVSTADRKVLTDGRRQHRDQIARLSQMLGPEYKAPRFKMALPPRTYQARETAIYLLRSRLLIADDVGLGKTAAAICSFTDPRTLPAVVVTLSHLPPQWEREIRKFLPELSVYRPKKTTPSELPTFMGHGPDVVILNYHKLDGWSKTLASYARSIVFDEVQELRRARSQKYAAAGFLARAMQFRLGLSATPVYNYGAEIFNVLNVLDPGCLGEWDEFINEWCTGDDAEKSKLKNPAAFGAWAREHALIIRHSRRDVGRELPAVTRIPHTVECDSKQLDAVENSAAALAQLILQSDQEMVRGERWKASADLSALLRKATGLSKAAYVADFVRILVESGESVVLFGWHREVYDIWLKKLDDLNPKLYTGSETPVQKEYAAQLFLRGFTKVLILSLRSGAGLDGLQKKCSVAVFGELDWSPGVHHQCIGRIHRDGQDTPVLAYFMVADEGSDPAISEMLGLKREQAEGVINPDSQALEETLDIDPARAKVLAARYLQQIGQPVPASQAVAS